MAHLLKDRTGKGEKKKSGGPPPAGTHERTASEAFEDLEAVFTSMDIDGEGRLDQASFMVALKSLNVKLPPEEVDDIFEQLDAEGDGYIAYSQFLTFLQMGKIPSSLLNRVKKSKVPRKSIIIGGSGAAALAMSQAGKMKASRGGGGAPGKGLLPVTEIKRIQQETAAQEVEELDPKQKKMVQRAVIVIKKAQMKKIKRTEVVDFLLDKGMSPETVELAFKKAQESAMTAEEKQKYLQELADSRERDLEEQKNINKYLTQEMTTHTRDAEMLRDLLRHCVDLMVDHYDKKFEQDLPKDSAEEINDKLKALKDDLAKAKEAEDKRLAEIHDKDLETLQAVARNMSDHRHYHAFLAFHCLPQVQRDQMPITQQFLSAYEDPEGDAAGY